MLLRSDPVPARRMLEPLAGVTEVPLVAAMKPQTAGETTSETRSFDPVQRSKLDGAGPAANSFGLKSVLTPTRDQRGEVTHSQANGIDCGASWFARGLPGEGCCSRSSEGAGELGEDRQVGMERDPVQREEGRLPMLARRLTEVRRTRARFVPVGDGSWADPDLGSTGFSLREREGQTTRRGPRSKDVIWVLLDLNGERTVAVRRCKDDRRWHSRTLSPSRPIAAGCRVVSNQWGRARLSRRPRGTRLSTDVRGKGIRPCDPSTTRRSD